MSVKAKWGIAGVAAVALAAALIARQVLSQSPVYNQFSPGGCLTGTWNNQGLDTGASGCTVTGGVSAVTQVFTSSGTWTMPTNATEVTVMCIGAGGGGAGGGGNTSGGGDFGGGAGGGGFTIVASFLASSLTSTVAVTVGEGGSGGIGGTYGSGDAGNGANGGTSEFGSYLTCYGGGGATWASDTAEGGTSAAANATGTSPTCSTAMLDLGCVSSANGSNVYTTVYGAAGSGVYGNNAAVSGLQGGTAVMGAGGGGGGAAADAAGTSPAAAGGSNALVNYAFPDGGAGCDTSDCVASAGSPGICPALGPGSGGGGGGGPGSGTGGTGGLGGKGACGGGGGGGGAAGGSGGTGGTGGAGGGGEVIVTTYR